MYQILLLLFLFVQPPQVEKHLLNHGPIRSIFEVKGIDISGNPCTIPIVNDIVPTLIESTKSDGTKYYIFDYANRRPYSEFINQVITYSNTVKTIKEEKKEGVKTPIKETVKTEPPKETAKETVKTEPPKRIYPPPTITEKTEFNLKKPSEIGKPR